MNMVQELIYQATVFNYFRYKLRIHKYYPIRQRICQPSTLLFIDFLYQLVVSLSLDAFHIGITLFLWG